MDATQFDTAVFTQGLGADRLKLFNRLRRMSDHHSDALSLGIVDGSGHRIRFLSDRSNGGKRNIAEEIRKATMSENYDKALAIVAEQIQKGEVIFEKHSKGADKIIIAFAKKEVVEKIKTMKLHDKQSGTDVGYNQVSALQDDQLKAILTAADAILPEKPDESKAMHPQAQKATPQAPIPTAPVAATPKPTVTGAPPTDLAAAKATLQQLHNQQEQKEHKAEKKKKERKQEEQIEEKEREKEGIEKDEIKREVIKKEAEHTSIAHDELHNEAAATELEKSEELQPEPAPQIVADNPPTSQAPASASEATGEETPKEVP